MELGNELGRFKSDIASYDSLRARVAKTSQNLFQAVMELNGMWEGAAHDAFEQNFRADNVTVEDVIKFLNSYKKDLDTALSEYQKCENSVESVISSIKV